MPTICRHLTARHRDGPTEAAGGGPQASWGSTGNRATARSARHRWPGEDVHGAQRPRAAPPHQGPKTRPLLRATATKTVESRASSA